MELREWADRILGADTLEDKLFCPPDWTDMHPGAPFFWKEPVRPPGMEFCRRSREEKLPPFQSHDKPENRAICLHRFAGHELLAVEIMAFTLVAFPEAPKEFRKGVAHTLREEQGHVRLYMSGMERLGIRFGDMPLYRHFWMHTPHITSPLHYISTMSLTFEMANLDFAPMYGRSFAHFGDAAAAEIMATILADEIRHVKFGWRWLAQLKQENTHPWDAWLSTLQSTKLHPKRAKGFVLHAEPRKSAGLPESWIEQLQKL